MLEFIKKLTAVLFYASIPLFVPFLYSIYLGDDAWIPIGLTILVLASPAVPQVISGIVDNIVNFLKSMLNPETPFNYAAIINTEMMRREVDTLTLGEILTVTSMVWLLVPIICTIPYLYYGIAPVDAFFESMSGWTSTGLSALPSLEGLPHSLILFRSITQWVGGLGIAVLILTAVKGKEALRFLKAEGRAAAGIGIAETVNLIFRTYLVLTVVGVALLMFTGIDVFNAVNLTFSGISNGGFFPFDSFEFSNAQKVVLALLMFAGATSFLFYRKIWRGEPGKAFLDEEFLLYGLITVSAIGLIVYVGGEELFNTILNTISSIACGGFAIGDLGVMHDFPIYILIILMLSGGMLGSTTGGIKLWRILVIFKAIALQIKAAFLPSGAVQVVKINGSPIDNRTIVESGTFIFTYLLLFLFATGLFVARAYDLEKALFLVASTIGNVGLTTVNIAALSSSAKAFLIALMYLGRIEIFPSLALISYIMGR
jgi:trk system potassium uptake protein TrkH